MISVPSCYLWDSNFYPFLSIAGLGLAVSPTPAAHRSSHRTCCTLLWKLLSSHAVSIPLILPWYPHPSSRQPVHILTLGGSLGSDLYFAGGSGLSAVTQDELEFECLSVDEVIRGDSQCLSWILSLHSIWIHLTQVMGSAQARCQSTVLAGHWCEHILFSSTHDRIWAPCRFRRSTRALRGHRVPVCTAFLLSSGEIYCFVLLAMLKFQNSVWQGERE